MPTVVIRVVATTAKVKAQPVQAARITRADGARVVVVATPGPPGAVGPPGPAGDGGFSFIQGVPAATWTITNTLGRRPAAVNVIVAGEVVDPDIDIPDISSIVLTFATPTAGRAEIM
jgi:hypothetical protein